MSDFHLKVNSLSLLKMLVEAENVNTLRSEGEEAMKAEWIRLKQSKNKKMTHKSK